MTDSVPMSGTDGPGKHTAARGADGMSGATVQQMDRDRAALGRGVPAHAPVAHA
jgi:predicted kinase